MTCCDHFFSYFELSHLLLCSLHLATKLLLDAGWRATECGDGEVALVQLTGQLWHLHPHSLHLTTVSLLGPLKLFSEL